MRKLDQTRSRRLAMRRHPARPTPKTPARRPPYPIGWSRREPTRNQRKAARRQHAAERRA